jgi:hypothetical protein
VVGEHCSAGSRWAARRHEARHSVPGEVELVSTTPHAMNSASRSEIPTSPSPSACSEAKVPGACPRFAAAPGNRV